VVYNKIIELSEITTEQEKYINKPIKFKSQTSYPFTSLPSDRDFERLLYYIFQEELKNKKTDFNYDEVILMQGSKDRGRDISLRLKSENVGLIQCKKYKKNLSRYELGKEILKFVLFSLDDNKLISNTQDNFYYYIAVSSDIEEKGKNLISEVNNNQFNKDEIRKWVKNLQRDYAAFKSNNFDANKQDKVIAVLEKLNIKSLICTDLDFILNEYPHIIRLFFEVDQVVDIEAFGELLYQREKKEIQLIGSLNEVEKRLKQEFPHLFELLETTKREIQKLMNQYSTHFIEYSEHNKSHANKLGKIVSNLLLNGQVKYFNEHELYILSNAFYLTDIGVCQSEETLKDKYYSDFTANKTYNYSGSFEYYLRRNHHKISFNFIKDERELLGIPPEYQEAIALVSQAHCSIQNNIKDQTIYQVEYTIDDYSTKTVYLPYLACLILLADNIDVENINSENLLRKFINYPKYFTSKGIWEEEKAKPKGQSSKDGERLSFNGCINDQLLYLGVSEHIQRLQEILKDCDQILRKLPASIGFSTFRLKFIDNNIQSPFKDEVGLSIDYKNIIHTFFGKKIYRDEHVAIRELIQNALDSCELKSKNEDGYTPKITIELNDSNLIVCDNALGMDKYVVENYFAKLGSSYYCDNNIQNSIGQFGVGVFSYFMLCNSFTVETKAKQSDALKFIVNQEAPYQFYFYENPVLSEGTKITIALKDDIKLTFQKLFEYVSTTFKHIKIPLKLKSHSHDEDDKDIIHQGFSLNKENVIENCIEVPYRQKFSTFEFYQLAVNNDESEGVCGILYPKNNIEEIIKESFDITTNFIEAKKGIDVFQKGIFITKISSGFVGEINIKTPKSLTINRENFEDNNFLDKLLDDLTSEFIKNFFSDISSKLIADTTKFFILNYYRNFKKNHYDCIGKYFYIRAYKCCILFNILRVSTFCIPFSHLDELSEIALIYVDSTQYSENILIKYAQKYSIYLIPTYAQFSIYFIPTYAQLNSILYYLEDKGFKITVINKSEISFLRLVKDSAVTSRINLPSCKIVEFDDDKLCSYPGRNTTYLNFNHPLINYWEENLDIIEDNPKVIELFNATIQYLVNRLVNIYFNTNDNNQAMSLSHFNSYIHEINQHLGTSFSLSKNDFPEWMESKIIE
jgi:molecular chaperone HtpG